MSMPNPYNEISSISYGPKIENEDSIPEYLDSEIINDTEITGALYSFKGSEIWQYIYAISPDQRDLIFKQINKNKNEGKDKDNDKDNKNVNLILEYSKNECANYFIRQILECNDDDRDKEKHKIIFEILINDIKELSAGKYSTCVIQKLIERVEEKDLEEIANKLGVYTDIDYFIYNENTNHVIQSLIKRQKEEENDKIFEHITNFVKVANDQYGCYIIIAILKKCTDKCYYEILKKCCENIVVLSKDFGNYIFKYFFENKNKDIKLDIIYPALKGNIYELSKDKKAVFVLKNALKLGNENQRKDIINELLELNKDKEDPLIYLSKHEFGNYVIQEVLDYCEPKTLKIIIKRIYSDPNIKKDIYGKHICKKIDKINCSKKGIFNNIIPGNHY